jgi:uncharacterized protein YqeY
LPTVLLKDRIKADRITAMKSGDKARKAILDYILGIVQTQEKAPGANPDIDPTEAVILSYIKSVKAEIAQGSPKSAEYEAEIAILSEYLPKPLEGPELETEIQAITATGITKKGLIIKALKEKHGARVDGKAVGDLLSKLGYQ